MEGGAFGDELLAELAEGAGKRGDGGGVGRGDLRAKRGGGGSGRGGVCLRLGRPGQGAGGAGQRPELEGPAGGAGRPGGARAHA